MAGMEALLWQLAQKQAQQQNSSPFSQFVNDAGAEGGGKLNAAGQSFMQAIMAPGNALRGEYDEREISSDGSVSQFDPRMMDDATNLAGSIGLSSMPIPRPAGSLSMGMARIVPDTPPDGFPIRPDEPFPFMHNTEGAFNHVPKGSTATALDPKGRFIIHDEGGLGRAPDNRWIKGEANFSKPLTLQGDNWKERLSQAYGGATGEELSKLLKADGYDGIVTFDKYGPSEIVDLR